uniref:RAB, member of RAS oncogene family-like 2 n=1 Tax=Astyanax mexicanus TaxID=7994 RepID=A0A8B9K287_ASTMX
MAGDANSIPELEQEKYDADEQVKIICLGDSAVGKSKLMERFLMDGYRPQQLSTYALTLYKYTTTINGKPILVGKPLREYRPEIPCLVVANEIDADMRVTQKSFNFAKKLGLPFYFVSAADGTNVVKVFKDAINMALSYKKNSSDFMDEVMRELENFELESKEDSSSDKEEECKEGKTD